MMSVLLEFRWFGVSQVTRNTVGMIWRLGALEKTNSPSFFMANCVLFSHLIFLLPRYVL